MLIATQIQAKKNVSNASSTENVAPPSFRVLTATTTAACSPRHFRKPPTEVEFEDGLKTPQLLVTAEAEWNVNQVKEEQTEIDNRQFEPIIIGFNFDGWRKASIPNT